MERIGKIPRSKIKDIAEQKMPDLNAFDIEGAMKIIEGTARSMGLTVVDQIGYVPFLKGTQEKSFISAYRENGRETVYIDGE